MYISTTWPNMGTWPYSGMAWNGPCVEGCLGCECEEYQNAVMVWISHQVAVSSRFRRLIQTLHTSELVFLTFAKVGRGQEDLISHLSSVILIRNVGLTILAVSIALCVCVCVCLYIFLLVYDL